MKKVIVISLFLFTFIACQEDLTNSDDFYSFVMEDHSNNQYQFPSGIYYEYTLADADSYGFDEVKVLKDLRHNGVQMKDAWYKNYSSSCTPPGSNISMQVIVPAEFIIRVVQTDIRLNSFGFNEISNPDISFCSYRVKHYTIK